MNFLQRGEKKKMKLSKKVLNRSKFLLLGVFLIVGLFWVGYGIFFPERNSIMEMMLGIMTMFMVLYAIPVFFTRIFAKQFDVYYKSLSEVEKQQFEAELANAKPGQNIILTSKAIVSINFIVISAHEYKDICRMEIVKGRKYHDKRILLYGEEKIEGVLVCKRKDCPEEFVKEIERRKEELGLK